MHLVQLFSIIIVIAILAVAFAGRFGKIWLLCAMVANLILANITGTYFFSVAGFDINVGNVFYVCAFFATQIFLEQNNTPKDRLLPLKIGSFFLFFFLIFSHALSIFTAFEGGATAQTLTTAFQESARITAASLLGFILAQHGHIYLYTLLQEKWKKKYVFFRSVIANGSAQLVDSCIFFTVAFFNISASHLLQVIFTGWVIKVFIGILASPILYAFTKKEQG